ncbi:MAG: SUMF1/EgtB/PvdO family nonheme iron enzyme [Lamprobacter sp.]|uniref:formylglycine-generating enzyme family protein n=1 Tax=Lamprobacter sp. TaxID=3100796 RepID=UPI002B25AC86|nr:SUMF1/EgtB/PvdO family nonheme iron enzyme [Lamprobacter sp.]MEA3639066.1 SUMF1/EgtB/PvdO family nonheme iron enzyme [Lamprobacter sp.]
MPQPNLAARRHLYADRPRRGSWHQRWMRRLGLGVSILGLSAAGLMASNWWLTGEPWPEAGWRWLETWLETGLDQIEPAPLKAALDQSAFTRAQRAGTEAAFQAYLDRCNTQGCAYRVQAEAQLSKLRLSAELAVREARLQRRTADLKAFHQALQTDTQAAFQTYLDDCAGHSCLYRAQAQQRLDTLQAEADRSERQSALTLKATEQAARATELEQQIEQLMAKLDLAAFAQADEANTEAAYQAYLKTCAETGCWNRAQAEARLAQLTDRAHRFAQEPEMAELRKGCFQMGLPTNRDQHRANRLQKVCVDAFKIAKHETTFAQYDHFTQATGRGQADDEGQGRGHRPVINVSWEEATAYAAWLSEQTGRRYRLPTEAEWEYAARAGTQTTRFWGDTADAACRFANVHDLTSMRENNLSASHHACDDGYANTAPVGQFEPNAWGLYDMLGNVWEWTCSAYAGNETATEQRCVQASNSGFRVIRGGGWHNGPRRISAAARNGVLPDRRYAGLGFRLAAD